MKFSGVNALILFQGALAFSMASACTAVDFQDSQFFILQVISANFSSISGGIGMDGALNNGNVLPGGIAQVVHSTLKGTGGVGTPLESITSKDTYWDFVNVIGVKPSTVSLLSGFVDEHITTLGNATWTKLDFESDMTPYSSERFSIDPEGNMEYFGNSDETLALDVTMSIDKQGGGVADTLFGLMKWDTIIGGTFTPVTGCFTRKELSSTAQSVTFFGSFDVSKSDKYFLAGMGEVASVVINIEGAQISVRK